MMLNVTRLVDRFLGRTTGHSARGRARTRPFLELLERRQLLSTALHFDFGTPKSPVAPGHVRVSADPYSSAEGSGWQSTAGLYTASVTPATASVRVTEPIVHIDATWLTQHGTAPYALD